MACPGGRTGLLGLSSLGTRRSRDPLAGFLALRPQVRGEIMPRTHLGPAERAGVEVVEDVPDEVTLPLLLVQVGEFVVDEVVVSINRVLPFGDVELHGIRSPALDCVPSPCFIRDGFSDFCSCWIKPLFSAHFS